MSYYILGAATMLIGVIVGYAINNTSVVDTEETAKWTQDIKEIK